MRVRTRRVATAATLALLLTAPGPAHAGQGPHKNLTVPQATDGQLDNDVRARAEFGLRADRAYVKKLYEDARAGIIAASTTQGAILTLDEDLLIAARTAEIDRVVDIADDYFKTHRAEYAGMWVDQARGLVGIGVTDHMGAHQQALSGLISSTGINWNIEQMDVSLDQLLDLQRQVDLMAVDLRARSVDITSTSIDEEANKVYIGAASDTSTLRDLMAEKFSAAAPIAVEYEAHARFEGVTGTDSPPFRGGQEIRRPLPEKPGYSAYCTSAFVAYQVERLDAAIFNFNYYLTTAGHCEKTNQNVGAVGGVWSQGSTVVGQSLRNSFKNGSIADGLAIPIQTAFKSNDVAIDPGVYREIRCMMTTDVKKGQIEIVSGAKTGGFRTGKLIRTNATVTYTNDETGAMATMNKQHMTDYASQSGDSGGSVFGTRECTYRADGVHSGGTVPGSSGPIRKYYSPIFNVTKELGLSGIEVS